MKLAVATYFTKSWLYSVPSWFRRVQANLHDHSGHLILSTDTSPECGQAVEAIRRHAGEAWEIHHCPVEVGDDRQAAYKEAAQLIIAKIQTAAFCKAREIKADMLWSVESDILPPPNALKVSLQALEFDDGYYGVAMVTYHNGQFLGGRGTMGSQICPDVYNEERNIPKELKAEMAGLNKKKTAKQEDWAKLDAKIKDCPPQGNVFHLQSKKWRKRGWLESAYPGIGKGAILPTDWVGMGCTLLNRKALMLAAFEGYELRGTQDLFLCWSQWNNNGIRMCVIPHIACSHVKRLTDKDGMRTNEIVVHQPYYETEGEYVGHLRVAMSKFHDFSSLP